jgi:hypothetical protein
LIADKAGRPIVQMAAGALAGQEVACRLRQTFMDLDDRKLHFMINENSLGVCALKEQPMTDIATWQSSIAQGATKARATLEIMLWQDGAFCRQRGNNHTVPVVNDFDQNCPTHRPTK